MLEVLSTTMIVFSGMLMLSPCCGISELSQLVGSCQKEYSNRPDISDTMISLFSADISSPLIVGD